MPASLPVAPAIAAPRIRLIDTEAERLTDLAVQASTAVPGVAAQLLGEIDRAELVAPGSMPADVVTMHSRVEYLDEGSGRSRTIELVYPPDADISAGRVSILTPVAAGLIGLAEGQAIRWPDRDGRERRLVILRVEQPAQQ